nr:hypothetical protein CcurKRNrm1_p057 [Cryptomonas curvata]
MNFKSAKWPCDIFLFQILSKKHILESILKKEISSKIRDRASYEKNMTLILFCSPVHSNLHRFLSENSTDILKIFLLNQFKKKNEKIKNKFFLFGIYLKKILYEFNLGFTLSYKIKIYFFTRMYKFEKNSHETIQKNFKFFNSNLYFWELVTLSKVILLESTLVFFNEKEDLFINMLEWVTIFKKISTFTNYKYEWSIYILSFIIFQKNFNHKYFLNIQNNVNKNKTFLFFSDLFDGSLMEKIFNLCKITLVCTFLNCKTRISILNKSLILVKYDVNFSGIIQKNKNIFSVISDSFKLRQYDKSKCTGKFLKNCLNTTSFSIFYSLYEKFYYFRKAEIDFFYKYDNYFYNKKKHYIKMSNLKIFNRKINNKILIKNYNFFLIFNESLLTFHYLNFSIAISYRKKTKLFVWINFLKNIVFCNFFIPKYLIAIFIFISFPKFQKKTKKLYLHIYVSLYLELICNFFNRKKETNIFFNVYSNENFLNLETNILKIEKIVTNHYFLFGYFDEVKFIKKKIKQQILYLEKNHSLFIKINYERLTRRLFDLTGTENIEKIFEILGKLNQDGKYFELISKINKNKISESKYFTGLILLMKKKIFNAKKQMFISVSFNPKNIYGWLYLGYIASILNDFSLCFRSYNKILSEEPLNKCAWVNLSFLFFHILKNKNEAYRLIKKVVKSSNNSLTVTKIYIYCSLDRTIYSWLNILSGIGLVIDSQHISQLFKHKILSQIFFILGEFFSKKFKRSCFLEKKKELTYFLQNMKNVKQFFKFFFQFQEWFGVLNFKIRDSLKKYNSCTRSIEKLIMFQKTKYRLLNLTLQTISRFSS